MVGLIIFLVVFLLAVGVFYIIAAWKIYSKAGKPGWAIFIPIYNLIVYLEIVGKPWWWIFLLMIPFVNIVLCIILIHKLSLSFGKDAGFTVGLLFLSWLFYPILAFGSAKYVGPGGVPATPPQV
jgi:hypothetical protein